MDQDKQWSPLTKLLVGGITMASLMISFPMDTMVGLFAVTFLLPAVFIGAALMTLDGASQLVLGFFRGDTGQAVKTRIEDYREAFRRQGTAGPAPVLPSTSI